MRTTIVMTMLLLCLGGVSRGDDPLPFHIKLSIMNADHPTVSRGSGGFTVAEGEFGRLTLAFYGGLENFQVQSMGTKQLPVTYLRDDMDPDAELTALTFAADFYIRPTVSTNDEIKLTSIINTMTRIGGGDTPAFRYATRRQEVIIPNNGEQSLTLQAGDGRQVLVVLSAVTSGPLVYAPKVYRHVTFMNEYSLYNDDTQSFELKSCGCTIKMGVDGGNGEGECSNRKVFYLPNGDVMLYLTSYTFRNVFWNDNNTLSFDLGVSHMYLTNPADTNLSAERIEAESGVMKELKKHITARAGERTEIEIPIEAGSPLPFKGKEVIVITNSIGEKVY